MIRIVKYKIKELRLARGLSLEMLSKLCGLNKSTIQEIEIHKTKPKFESILKIAKALEVALEELYEEINTDITDSSQ